MKHPLTSKERRGLVAVATAALLCIASGPVLRSCGLLNISHSGSAEVIVDTVKSIDADTIPDKADTPKNPRKSKESKKKSGKKATKKKAAKEYPVRSPLDQPCDI